MKQKNLIIRLKIEKFHACSRYIHIVLNAYVCAHAMKTDDAAIMSSSCITPG